MTPNKAFGGMPPPGDPVGMKKARIENEDSRAMLASLPRTERSESGILGNLDTSYIVVTDARGNSISLTPSDFPVSPMVPGTGLCLGIRMVQFRLDPEHPAALMPGKRPRATPNSVMVTRGGELFMTFGTPESDQQPQALLQFFINLIVFEMDIQDAIDAPRFRSKNFPDSFSPHEYTPGVIALEKSLNEKVGAELAKMGYKIEIVEDWHYEMGAVGAIIRDAETGRLTGGADARQENWADGR